MRLMSDMSANNTRTTPSGKRKVAATSATECGLRHRSLMMRCSAVDVRASLAALSFVVTMVSMASVVAERVRPPVLV
ncbi:hypothetical protein ADK67_13995 [Saccharothrix sp. NRRL B-16348]|nr:hypothetical protein ADK67_13995 [Saccharothrix sp. NRRL B-16348]